MDLFDLRKWPNFVAAGGSSNDEAIIDEIVIDSRRIQSKSSLFVALKGAKQDGHQFVRQASEGGARYALVSHDWVAPANLGRIQLLRVADPLKAIQEIAKTYRAQLPVKVIAITGTYGKTMVKDLLHAFLAKSQNTAASPESFNSQIGVPLSLFTINSNHSLALIEAAISQKEEMDALVEMIQPNFTILTPIGNKHLTTLEDLTTTTQEVMKLILHTPQTGWSLIPSNELVDTYRSKLMSPYYIWNEPNPQLPHVSSIQDNENYSQRYRITFPDENHYEGQMFSGYSYYLNLLNMCVKAAWLSGVSATQIKEVLDVYRPEPMRTEIWKAPGGATFINDTYCSDPQSIERSLKFFEFGGKEHQNVFLFGGLRGNDKQAEMQYRLVGRALKQANLKRLILFGNKPFGPLIKEIERDYHTEITVVSDFKEALEQLQLHIGPQDIILIKGENKAVLDQLIETFNDSLNNNQCTINLAAIKSNLDTLKKKLPPSTRIMVIVKALAYGTDDIRMAKFLAGCDIDILGVSYVDEGVTLRRAGVQQEIFSINAAPYEAAKVAKWDLQVGVSDKELIEALAKEAKEQNKPIKLHLHVNTGMGRFGCRPEEALELARKISSSPNLILEGIMTHFACADDPAEDEFTKQQISLFDKVIAELEQNQISPKWRHASNSSAAIRFSLSQYNMARIGLAVYGLYVSQAAQECLDLRLALSLTSRIVGITHCRKGETVSYGRSYKIEREEQKIAILPIGYFDGLHRHYSGKAHVYVRGHEAPMVAKICMDYMMIDVTDVPNVTVGDKVLIFGEDENGQFIAPEDLASRGDSIVHELITCLGPRIQRIFIYEEGSQIR